MDKEELNLWKEKYNSEEDSEDKSAEEDLNKKFQENNFITKQDLERIVKWKFTGQIKGRQTRFLNLVSHNNQKSIEEISRCAFKIKDDETRLRLLSSLKGIGPSLSSVILTFYDPQHYGILDIHVWRGLFGKEQLNIFSNENAIKFFNKLREISSKNNLSCRDIEKAYFKREKDK